MSHDVLLGKSVKKKQTNFITFFEPKKLKSIPLYHMGMYFDVWRKPINTLAQILFFLPTHEIFIEI